MKTEILEIVKEVAIALGVMKFVHPNKGAEATGASAAGASQDDSKTAKVRFGGFWDYTDEEGYAGLIGQMKAAKAITVAEFLNKNLSPMQRQKFRAIVANLSRVAGEKPAPPPSATPAAGAQPAKPAPTAATAPAKQKPSLGLKFMNCLADCADDNDRMAICQSAGVMESLVDNLSDTVAHISDQMGKAALAIEQNPIAQTVMVGLADLMRADIDRLNNKP